MRIGYFLPLSEGGVLAQLAEHDLTEGSDAAAVVLKIFLLVRDVMKQSLEMLTEK